MFSWPRITNKDSQWEHKVIYGIPVLDTPEKSVYDIVLEFSQNEKTLRNSDDLEQDLGIDSLDRVELAMTLEDEYDIEITDEVHGSWNTVEDIYNSVNEIKNNRGVE